jgi:hypothetical protein
MVMPLPPIEEPGVYFNGNCLECGDTVFRGVIPDLSFTDWFFGKTQQREAFVCGTRHLVFGHRWEFERHPCRRCIRQADPEERLEIRFSPTVTKSPTGDTCSKCSWQSSKTTRVIFNPLRVLLALIPRATVVVVAAFVLVAQIWGTLELSSWLWKVSGG